MPNLTGKVCIVTGASRGIGKGIALQLGQAGATVYITGRTLNPKKGDPVGGSLSETAKEIESRGGRCIPVQCDHTQDTDIEKLFEQVKQENNGRLDILVNNAYAAVKSITENVGVPFWEQPMHMWDTTNNVGLRNHYMCCIYAARLMVPNKEGLIVNVSSPGGLSYFFNVPYGVGKQACDRMMADCAVELRKHHVTCVSLWPMAVKTENIVHHVTNEGFLSDDDRTKRIFIKGESIEYPGMAIAHLATDCNLMKKSGKILLTADLGDEYNFTDIDGSKGLNIRHLKTALLLEAKTEWMSKFVPGFIYVPKWALSLAGNKF